MSNDTWQISTPFILVALLRELPFLNAIVSFNAVANFESPRPCGGTFESIAILYFRKTTNYLQKHIQSIKAHGNHHTQL
jgi:hypothetical protein